MLYVYPSVNIHAQATCAHSDEHILSEIQSSELQLYDCFPLKVMPNPHCSLYSDEKENMNRGNRSLKVNEAE